MGLFDFLFGKKNKSTAITPAHTAAVSRSTALAPMKNQEPANTALIPANMALTKKQTDFFNVHPDIVDLVWIGNGEHKNFFEDSSGSKSTFTCNGYTFTLNINFPGSVEPSLIDTRQPISQNVDYSTVESPPYYPTYNDLSPEQKGVYWHLLSNPYNPNIDIGFVFILYYGLERFLMGEKYEEVFNVIYKLREVHTNNSFQFYATNAMTLTAIIRNRADLLARIVAPVSKEYEQYGFVDLLLLSKLLLEMSLSAKEVIKYAKAFGFTNNNYIKNYPDMFEKSLRNVMIKRFASSDVLIDAFVGRGDLKNLQTKSIPIFANTSIREKMIPIPNLVDYPQFKAAMFAILEEAHNTVKLDLANLRKTGKAPEKKTSTKKPKEVLTFDSVLESELLGTLKNQRPF